jgi:hypothetical protein
MAEVKSRASVATETIFAKLQRVVKLVEGCVVVVVVVLLSECSADD